MASSFHAAVFLKKGAFHQALRQTENGGFDFLKTAVRLLIFILDAIIQPPQQRFFIFVV
jgi:hypothetical protein